MDSVPLSKSGVNPSSACVTLTLEPMEDTKIVLIGGTSHVGKSTLGQQLADALGWDYQSTDQLARHPGRPWRTEDRAVPEHVAHYYAGTSSAELLQSVLMHYRTNVWPIVDAMVRSRLRNRFDHPLVLEGSAILPNQISLAAYDRVRAVWLCASEEVITARIKASSGYESATPADRRLVDAFIGRSIGFNALVRTDALANSLVVLDADSDQLAITLNSMASGGRA